MDNNAKLVDRVSSNGNLIFSIHFSHDVKQFKVNEDVACIL